MPCLFYIFYCFVFNTFIFITALKFSASSLQKLLTSLFALCILCTKIRPFLFGKMANVPFGTMARRSFFYVFFFSCCFFIYFSIAATTCPHSCSSTSPKKITSINACRFNHGVGQIWLCLRQKFALLTELGARFTPSSFPYCSISSPFLLLLRLAHFSLFHHAKKNNKHKCLLLGLSLNNCMGSNRALPSAKVRSAHRTWGKIYSVFFPLLLSFISLFIAVTTCPLLALPPRQKK